MKNITLSLILLIIFNSCLNTTSLESNHISMNNISSNSSPSIVFGETSMEDLKYTSRLVLFSNLPEKLKLLNISLYENLYWLLFHSQNLRENPLIIQSILWSTNILDFSFNDSYFMPYTNEFIETLDYSANDIIIDISDIEYLLILGNSSSTEIPSNIIQQIDLIVIKDIELWRNGMKGEPYWGRGLVWRDSFSSNLGDIDSIAVGLLYYYKLLENLLFRGL